MTKYFTFSPLISVSYYDIAITFKYLVPIEIRVFKRLSFFTKEDGDTRWVSGDVVYCMRNEAAKYLYDKGVFEDYSKKTDEEIENDFLTSTYPKYIKA